MSDDVISNAIALIALLLSAYSLCQTKRTEDLANQREETRDKLNKLFELEQKLDFILANRKDEIIRYKVETFQKDLQVYCNLYGLDSEIIFRAYAKIYVPLTNDGEDIVFDIKELFHSSGKLINLLK